MAVLHLRSGYILKEVDKLILVTRERVIIVCIIVGYQYILFYLIA